MLSAASEPIPEADGHRRKRQPLAVCEYHERAHVRSDVEPLGDVEADAAPECQCWIRE